AMSAPDSELVGCPDAAAVVLMMIPRRMTFAFACRSGKLMRADTVGDSCATFRIGWAVVEDMTLRLARHTKKIPRTMLRRPGGDGEKDFFSSVIESSSSSPLRFWPARFGYWVFAWPG